MVALMDPPPPTPWITGRSRAVAVLATFLLGGCALAACSGDGGVVEETDAVTGGSGTSTPEGYPEGPYGADVGEILPNLVWRGFVEDDGAGLATDGGYRDYSLDDARRSGARWALLHFGAVF
jgi:hypothetical protein